MEWVRGCHVRVTSRKFPSAAHLLLLIVTPTKKWNWEQISCAKMLLGTGPEELWDAPKHFGNFFNF